MKKNMFWKVLVLVMVFAMALSFAACGSGEAEGDDTEGNGITVKVGSKDFTEQLILGQLTIQVLEDAGYTVEDKTNVSGSDVCRAALEDGEFDVYWEYTGTAWLSFLGNTEVIAGAQPLYDALVEADAANGITWLDYAPMNDTYALVMKAERAEELGITSYSELGEYVTANPGELVLAADHEFTVRPDGLPGLVETYGCDFGEDIVTMDMGIVYQTLGDGQADVGMVFATDGRIPQYGLVVLTDDKSFFPVYNAAPCLRTEFADANPEIAELLNPIAALLTDEVMQNLNYQVDGEALEPDEVAHTWLVEQGFLAE